MTELPKTWAEFNAACDKAVAAGLICLAHMSADWTDATTFEVVVYGQDIDLFRKAFVEGDIDALRSPGMVKAFEQFRTDGRRNTWTRRIAGRDYDTTSNMMANGEALFFIMGDWEIGMLTAAGFKEGADGDYVCAQAPTDWGKPGFILNSDSVVFFQQSDPDYIDGQKLLAHLILSPEFQTVFNQAKGSIPARLDIDLSSSGFNPCQQLSQKDLQASIEAGTLVRSMAHNMTVLQKYRGAMMDVDHRVRELRHVARGRRQRHGRRGRSADVDRRRRRRAAGPALGEPMPVTTLDRDDDRVRPDGPPASRDRLGRAGAVPGARCPRSSRASSTSSSSPPGRSTSRSPTRRCCRPTASSASRTTSSLWANQRWNIAYTNLFLFSGFYVVGSIAVGLLLAILIDQRVRGESIWRTIFLYPLAVSFIVTGTVWSWLYNPTAGIQFLVRRLGLENFTFALTTDRNYAIYAIILTGIWQSSGFAMALFLAGLRSVDQDLVKAAQIDGAGAFRIYRRVILPTIAPIFIAVAVVLLQFAIKTFDLVVGADRAAAPASPPPSRRSTSTT